MPCIFYNLTSITSVIQLLHFFFFFSIAIRQENNTWKLHLRSCFDQLRSSLLQVKGKKEGINTTDEEDSRTEGSFVQGNNYIYTIRVQSRITIPIHIPLK